MRGRAVLAWGGCWPGMHEALGSSPVSYLLVYKAVISEPEARQEDWQFKVILSLGSGGPASKERHQTAGCAQPQTEG